MEISLKPDFLGKVVIKLSMDGGGSLIAKISASNPKVQDAMMNQAGALQSSLEAQGLKDVRIVVTSSAVADASLQQQADRRGQGDDSRNRRNAVVVDAADAADPSSPLSAYEQAYRTGSINYLA
jgi:flagellar hook-length control protein FliK